MRNSFIIVLFLVLGLQFANAQPNFMVSCPAEIKMNGKQSHLFMSHHTYIIYNPNTSILKLVINLFDLQEPNTALVKGEEVSYLTNIEDSNSLVFEGSVPEEKIRPKSSLQDTYTFAVTGTFKYRELTYTNQIVCSYGSRMLRNSSQIALNINFEILQMDYPMFITYLNELIDNIMVKIADGTVNVASN